MKTAVVFFMPLIFLIGCTNHDKEALFGIADLQAEINLKKELVTSNFIIDRIGQPDKKFLFNEWETYIKNSESIYNKERTIESTKANIIRSAKKNNLNINDYQNVDVWVYMLDHNYEARFERFMLPPIFQGFFERPFFVLYDNKVITNGLFIEK